VTDEGQSTFRPTRPIFGDDPPDFRSQIAMTDATIRADTMRRIFLILLAVAISLLFLAMIRQFLTALLLAGILTGMFAPLYRRLLARFKGKRGLASATTIAIVLLAIIIPLTGFLGIVAAQAVQLSQTVRPWVEQQIQEPNQLDRLFERVPFVDALKPYRDQIVSKVGELAGRVGTFVVGMLAATARDTAMFFFLLFVMLYAMFFFLIDGKSVLNKILYYMPLPPEDENRMVEKFVSVSRATIKGTLIIGILQGALAGIAFWVVGINGAAFWGTVMAVLSIIPGVGAALVWVPAVIYLLAVGKVGGAIGLGVWCAALVGTVDNFLRPRLVGKDTKMPDLLILLATLGGILLFGAIGIVIGPIVAALFVTVWDIYGTAFKDILPEVEPAPALASPQREPVRPKPEP
jgi:predicted PurR-regulated permease PerM